MLRGVLSAFQFVGSAWRSITRVEFLFALSVGGVVAVVSALLSTEFLAAAWDKRAIAPSLAYIAFSPLSVAILGLLTWVVADRMPDHVLSRPRRLAAALLATIVLHASVSPVIAFEVLGIPDPCSIEKCEREGKPVPPLYMRHLGEIGYCLVFGGFAIVLIELNRRSRLANEALVAAQQERTSLQRLTFESRLAAMQAQVEPQFLFDSLVDVQALYERDAAGGSATLDRLIAYLRTALPRLRESGSTVGAEAELVSAYLSVVTARHGGHPEIRIVVPPECAAARFYPMLLLPLVQRALRGESEPPERVELVFNRAGDEMVAVLRFDAAGLCADDAELARVRERLAGLYGSRARLDCIERDQRRTEFTLTWPREIQPQAHVHSQRHAHSDLPAEPLADGARR